MRCTAQDAAAIVLPAHTMKAEARQFGAEPLADLAEQIEFACRRALESHLFPDDILPEVAKLRPLYLKTMALLEEETNPLAQRRAAASARSRATRNSGGSRPSPARAPAFASAAAASGRGCARAIRTGRN